jgi:hypothetical protein
MVRTRRLLYFFPCTTGVRCKVLVGNRRFSTELHAVDSAFHPSPCPRSQEAWLAPPPCQSRPPPAADTKLGIYYMNLLPAFCKLSARLARGAYHGIGSAGLIVVPASSGSCCRICLGCSALTTP